MSDNGDPAQVTRIDLIDHRAGVTDFGRIYSAWFCAITLSYQDDGRTLKVFVTDAPRSAPSP
jgi:hypothetical protein